MVINCQNSDWRFCQGYSISAWEFNRERSRVSISSQHSYQCHQYHHKMSGPKLTLVATKFHPTLILMKRKKRIWCCLSICWHYWHATLTYKRVLHIHIQSASRPSYFLFLIRWIVLICFTHFEEQKTKRRNKIGSINNREVLIIQISCLTYFMHSIGHISLSPSL